LGKFSSEKHKEGKTRPIKVILHTKECRDKVMRNLYKLGESDSIIIKKAQLGYDLNEEERDEVKKKLEEAKALTSSQDDFFWKVRGPPWAMWLKREKKRIAQAIVP
jgi:hypothetical protein